MPYATIEDRVDRLEALFGHFLTEGALMRKHADERAKAAEERMERFEQEMREFKDEMRGFKDEMRQSKRDLDKKWGDLANKMGTLIEDILAPNLRRLATEYFGFSEILETLLRWNRKKPNQPSSWQEFDAVFVGPESVIVGEAKSSVNLEAADRFAEKLRLWPDFAPHLSHLRVIPVMGCWSIPQEAVDRLTAHGIYAMCMGDDTMDIVNGDHITRK